MTNLVKSVPFSFENHSLTVVTIDDKPWFIAKEVCEILGYPNTSQTISTHLGSFPNQVLKLDSTDSRYANIRPILAKEDANQILLISESGLYTLCLRSKRPQAVPFQVWVTEDVLPSIRTTGSYSLDPKPQMQLIVQLNKQIDDIKTLVLESIVNSQSNANYLGQAMEKIAQAFSGHPLLVGRNAGEKTVAIHGIARRLISNGSFDYLTCDSRDDADIVRDIRDIILDLGKDAIPLDRRDWNKNDILELSYVMKYYKKRLKVIENQFAE